MNPGDNTASNTSEYQRVRTAFLSGYYASNPKSRSAPRMSPLCRADNLANFMHQSARNWDSPPSGAQRVRLGLYRECNWH